MQEGIGSAWETRVSPSRAQFFLAPITSKHLLPEEKCLKVREWRTDNKFNPHTASTPRFKPGGPEASSLTTAPPLLPKETQKLALGDLRVRILMPKDKYLCLESDVNRTIGHLH